MEFYLHLNIAGEVCGVVVLFDPGLFTKRELAHCGTGEEYILL